MSVKVSVIVPVYNAEGFLPKCLECLTNQTLKDIEIICVNDGSTDNSLDILEKFAKKDNRIKIVNQENQGVSCARNNAMKVAIGEYISFIDSDDTVSLNFLELLYDNAVKYGADIACGEIVRPVENEVLLKFKKVKTYTKTHQKYKVCKIPFLNYSCNKIYNREKLMKIGYEFPKDKIFEDILWSHIVLDKLGKLVTVPNAVYYYYLNPTSLSVSYSNQYHSKKEFAGENLSSLEYIATNRIKIRNYDGYTPKKRIRINLFGIRIFDLKLWDSIKILYVFGIKILTIYVNNAKS